MWTYHIVKLIEMQIYTVVIVSLNCQTNALIILMGYLLWFQSLINQLELVFAHILWIFEGFDSQLQNASSFQFHALKKKVQKQFFTLEKIIVPFIIIYKGLASNSEWKMIFFKQYFLVNHAPIIFIYT